MRSLATLAFFCLFNITPLHADDAPPTSPPALEQAMDELLTAIRDSAAALRADPYYEGDLEQAAGASYWARMLIRTLEEDIVQDPDFPLFRVVDYRVREGGDNPDQRYLVAPIRGNQAYRIRGQRAGERRIEVQVYAGRPWTPRGGRVVSVLTHEQLKIAPDGSVEILIDPQQREGNWLATAADADMVMVRQVFSDWAHERAGEFHIDRVGHEGDLRPAEDSAAVAARLRRAAANVREVVPLWPRAGRTRWARAGENTLTPPSDPSADGGVKGRLMSLGEFRLAPDEALILTTWLSTANYQGVQLTDSWTSSLEYANRQSSLTTDQAWRGKDGAYRFVISHRDPGVQNWLDTMGLAHGFVLLRYDGLQGSQIAREHWPRLEKVRFDQLKDKLPPDTPVFDGAQRSKAILQRRRHVQQRFGV